MIVIPDQRLVESRYIDWIGHGYTAADGCEMRPAEYNWHLIFTRDAGVLRILVVGALEQARPLGYTEGAESLWIRFRVGTFLRSVSALALLNREICLPAGSGNGFWLNDRVWEIPTYENVETFVEQMVRAEALGSDPLIEAALRDELPTAAERTIRYRFQRSTGLGKKTIQQIERAQRAAELLQAGQSILHTAHEMGYADQAHLTRSLKRLRGCTPGEILSATS